MIKPLLYTHCLGSPIDKMVENMPDSLPTSKLQADIEYLKNLIVLLGKVSGINEKLEIISTEKKVKSFLDNSPQICKFLKNVSKTQEYLLKTILVLGQGEIVFRNIHAIENPEERLYSMLNTLQEVERFYNTIGGILGYHLEFIKHLLEKNEGLARLPKGFSYNMPIGEDISKDSKESRQYVRWGIEYLPEMAEIYAVGGSGDRLNFHDNNTGEALPVAALTFFGKTLLEGLVLDLQAREFLFYKIHARQLTTPIAMMTSMEKNNHNNILKLCEENRWFGRNAEDFFLFVQPLVPVITIEGEWVMKDNLSFMLKPGGHGALWKQALDNGVFKWLEHKHKRSNGLVRQINNPAAGIDSGLLAFTGIGCHYKKDFGFASCPRLLNTAEGMDVLIEHDSKEGTEYRTTNVEYTDFEHYGIKDVPSSPGSPFSMFPANTNILFVNLSAVQPIIEAHPVPGILINLKNKVSHIDSSGQERILAAGRLESTMQNIADFIVDKFSAPLKKISSKDFRTFITFNDRKKTLSVTKKVYTPGSPLVETPEGCFYEMLENHHQLLTQHCQIDVPPLDQKAFLKNGPSFLFSYHPALGPLYSIISQKLQGGKLAYGSELQLQITELDIKKLDLDGSLLIRADNVMGRTDEKGIIAYGEDTGKCSLLSVTIKNKGIDRNSNNDFISLKINRTEALEIILHGNAEFHAENVVFQGPHKIEVPNGHRMTAFMQGNRIHYKMEKINIETWFWSYSFNQNNEMVLQKTAPQIV